MKTKSRCPVSLSSSTGIQYLLDVLHPLCHLLVAHVVDLLDEGIVLLPEGHPRAGLELPKQRQSHNSWVSFVLEKNDSGASLSYDCKLKFYGIFFHFASMRTVYKRQRQGQDVLKDTVVEKEQKQWRRKKEKKRWSRRRRRRQ
jgi:hypothetical protein